MDIIHEDDAIIVCIKESGVATQTKRIGEKDMESILINYRVQKGEPPYIGVVHRLDQPVAGVMVFAKTKEAAADLSRQMSQKIADKYYYAITDGIPEPRKGTLVDYLLRDGKTNTSKVVERETPGAKRAELYYEVLQAGSDRALIRVELATGRHHQIRVQMAHAGYPLVGDRKYNFKTILRRGQEYISLYSYYLAFFHPTTKQHRTFETSNRLSLYKKGGYFDENSNCV